MSSNTTGTTLASLAAAPATLATWLGKLQYLLADLPISNLVVTPTGNRTEMTGNLPGVGTIKVTNTNILGKNYGTLALELTDGSKILAMGYFSSAAAAGHLKMTGSASSLYVTDTTGNIYSARGIFGLSTKTAVETPAALTLSEVVFNGLSRLVGSIAVAPSLKTTGSITGITIMDASHVFDNGDFLGRVSKAVKLDAASLSMASLSGPEIAKASAVLAKALLTEIAHTGSAGDDAFHVTKPGIYTFSGLAGTDTVYLSGNLADYDFYRAGSNVLVAAGQARMQFVTLTDIDTFHFANGTLSWQDLLKKTPSAYADWLEGASGADSIDGLAGNDSLFGGAGNDTLVGGAGDDELHGGDGDDTYYVDSVKDVVTKAEGAGFDTIYSSMSINLPSHVEQIYFTGAKAVASGNGLDNRMFGTPGNDSLSGGDGNDLLAGNGGNDTLMGGTGNDTLVGGTGKDVLIGGPGSDVFALGPGLATIKDFEPGKDKLQIAKAVFATVHPGLADTFELDNLGQGAKASTTNQFFVFDPKKSALFYDADGSGPGKGIQLAVIAGVKSLSLGDIGLER